MKRLFRLGHPIQNLVGEDLSSWQTRAREKDWGYFAPELAMEAVEFQESLKDVVGLQGIVREVVVLAVATEALDNRHIEVACTLGLEKV